MATVKRRGLSYSIRVSCGYDVNGKQIIKSMTWKPQPDMSAAQAEKEAQRQAVLFEEKLEMSRNVQSGNTQNLKSMVIQRSFPKWSVAERRKTAAASDQAAVCARIHSRYFAGGSPSGLRV